MALGSIGIDAPFGSTRTISVPPARGLSGRTFGYAYQVADPSTTHRPDGSALADNQRHDPVQWMRHYWEQQTDADPSGFLAMTSLLRLHHLMTTSVEQCLRADVALSLTDYQILKALQLSDSGTWLLSRLAWHLMVHTTTVTLTVERLEARELVKRHSHPRDRRATLVSITDGGRELVDAATDALGRMEYGLPGLSTAQARSLISTVARLRAGAGDFDRSYASAPDDLR
ncbi:MarR family transcriptional regulator [Mycolicibacterium moriokaense]|nr:MarR family transcriptional regulator [Mycolicibacterium moriokaense]